MKPFIKAIKALSDPNRVKIVKLLQYKTLCVCELQGAWAYPNRRFPSTLKFWRKPVWSDTRKTVYGSTTTWPTAVKTSMRRVCFET